VSKSTFDRIMAGTQEAIANAKGEPGDYVVHIPDAVDVKAIRAKMGFTQPRFAQTFGFSLGRVRDWEQGRSAVDAPNRAFMTILEREPGAALRALGISEVYATRAAKKERGPGHTVRVQRSGRALPKKGASKSAS
jgi:putative transcriptional regulator